TASTPDEASSGPEPADNPGGYPDAAPDDDLADYSDADIDAFLAAEDQLPEPRTRQEARADTWGDSPDDPADSELDTEHDGDVAALLAEEEQLPEPRTRQEAKAATWGDTTQPDDDDPAAYSGDPASEYDGDVAALLAAEEQLPEPRTRQEAKAATWGDANNGQGTAPDTSTDATSPGPPDAGTGPPARHDEGEDGAADPYERQVAVHTTDGTDVPVTVELLSPEARTVGDTTPTGIGHKPTGEEFLDMESDNPAESSFDKLLKRANEGAGDLRDTIGSATETLHDLRLPGSGPSGGHAHEGHPVHEAAPPAGPAFSDLTGSAALVFVALLTSIRYVVRQLGKGDGR
ncbi:MAG: hypothetical protein ACRDQ1_19355, partial [Sciscionella sp.]